MDINEKEIQYYDKYYKDMILRDYLALDRTKLANKRTLLSYLRTFIGFLAAGVGIIELWDNFIIRLIGYFFIAAAFLILVIGIIDYIKMKKSLSKIIF